jgi:hypothetical protein
MAWENLACDICEMFSDIRWDRDGWQYGFHFVRSELNRDKTAHARTNREWCRRNRESERERHRTYRQTHPDKRDRREYLRNYRLARKKVAG